VAGVGAKTLAALRRAVPPAAAQAQRDGAGEAGAPAQVPAPLAAPPAASAPADTPPEPAPPAPSAAGTAASAADDTLAELAAAAEGLLVPSESDHPFTPFRWEGAGPLTPAALLAHLGLPPETPVEVRTLESFFAPLSQPADWMDDSERATIARFAALRDHIAATLTGAAVYYVGETKITVIIAGQDPAGRSVGLQTTLIET
jgi:hypothetical protein